MTQELIAKLKNLTAPCRDIDAEIYAFISDDDGFIPFKVFRQQAWPKAPRFTESIDAGLSYVPEELSAYINLDPEKPFVRLYDSGGWLVTECLDTPPAIALNICALTVLGM